MSCSIELETIDILMKISCLYQDLYSPREEHLDSVYHIFEYLQKNLGKNPGITTWNPLYDLTAENVFEVDGIDLYRWKNLYLDAQEMMPGNILEALGK